MVDTALIKELREKTGAGMMDCKKALEEVSGDLEKAVVALRKQGLADIKKRTEKKAAEGSVGHYIHAGGKIGVLVEVNCETDFSSNSKDFQTFVRDVAMHIAASNPQWISRDEVPQEIIDREKSIIEGSLTGKPPQVIEKIVAGKLTKFYKEACLLDQPFVKDPNLSINDLVGELGAKISEKIVVRRFSRFVLGEGIE